MAIIEQVAAVYFLFLFLFFGQAFICLFVVYCLFVVTSPPAIIWDLAFI